MKQKHRKLLETTLCLLVLVVLPMLAFFPMVVQQKVPGTVGAILCYPPWEEARPSGFEPDCGQAAPVEAQRYYPWYAFINKAGFSADALFWNPNEGCGTPFWALWRTRCLSPFSLPFYLLPFAAALRISLIAKLVVAGLCAFYAARRLGFAKPIALAVAVAFQFSGHVYLGCERPMSDVIVWLPLLLIYTERLALGQFRYWPRGAIVVGLLAAGGDPETLAAAILLAFIYLSVRIASNRTEPSTDLVSLLPLAVSSTLGLALVAVQLGPYLEFLRETVSASTGTPSSILRLSDLVLFFFPHFTNAGKDPSRDVQALQLLYVGLPQLWFLLLWFSFRPFLEGALRRRIEALLLTSALMTLVAITAGRVLTYVPLVRHIGPEHFLIANTFILALMSAAVADEWLHLNTEECKTTIRRFLFILPLPLLVFVAFLLVYGSSSTPETPSLWLQLLAATGLTLAWVILMGYTLMRPSVRVMGYGLSALIFLSSLFAFSSARTFVDGEALFPETSFIAALKSTGERIGGSEALKKWPLAGNHIPQVYSPSGVLLKRQAAFMEQIKRDPLLLRHAGAPALLLTKEDIQGVFASIRPVLAIKKTFPSGAVLFDDLDAKPRAWVAYKGRAVDTFDPADLSPDLPPLIEGAPPPNAQPESEAKVVLLESDTAARVPIQVETTHPGVLVLADTYYPGWRATVDGEEADVFPVDGMFRGIHIKEGKHEIEFRYEPLSFRIGLYISAAAALIIIIEVARVFLLGLWRRFRARKEA